MGPLDDSHHLVDAFGEAALHPDPFHGLHAGDDVPADLRRTDDLRPIFATDSESSAHTLPPFGGVVFACAKE